jgi:DNA-binding transcriptional LysR family regulator
MVLCCPEKIGPSGGVDLDTFAAASHAVFTARDGNCRIVQDELERLALNRLAIVTTPHLCALPNLVRRTGAMATVPASIAANWAPLFGLKVSPLPFEVPAFDISMVWHASFDRDAAHSWLRAQILAAASDTRGLATEVIPTAAVFADPFS